MKNAHGAAPFDRGRKAGLNGQPKRPNPYDHPDHQNGSTIRWEQRASEWDEGWSTGNAERLELQIGSIGQQHGTTKTLARG